MYIKADINEIEKVKKALEDAREECAKKFEKIVQSAFEVSKDWQGVDMMEYIQSFENGKARKIYNEVDKGLLIEINRLDYIISEYKGAMESASNMMRVAQIGR